MKKNPYSLFTTGQLLDEVKKRLGEIEVIQNAREMTDYKSALKAAVKDAGEYMRVLSVKSGHCKDYVYNDLKVQSSRVSLWRVFKIAKMCNLRMCFVNKKGHVFPFKAEQYFKGNGVWHNPSAKPGDAEIFQ